MVVDASDIRGLLERAGKSATTFYRYVKQGKIQRTEEGYLKSDVDAFLRGEMGKGRKRKPSSTRQATIDLLGQSDLGYVYLFEFEQFAPDYDKTLPAELLWAWREKNKYTTWIARDPQNVKDIWAILVALPLPEETVNRLISKEISLKSLRPEDILAYIPGEHYTCYIALALSKPTKVDYFMQLIERLTSYWGKMADRGAIIDKVFVPVIEETLEETAVFRMVKECFFSPWYERGIWELRTKVFNPSPLVKRYQRRAYSETEMSEKMTTTTSVTPIKRVEGLQARFRKAASRADIVEIIRIGDAIFGARSGLLTDKHMIDLFSSWLHKNPEVFHVVEVDDRIVGFSSLLPLTEEKIQDIISERIRITDVTAEDIQAFRTDSPFSLFVHVLGTDPALSEQEKRTNGRRLLEGLISWFESLARREIEIAEIHARSATLDGIGLSLHLGFDEVAPPLGVTKKVFKLVVAASSKPFFRRYRNLLEAHRRGEYGIFEESSSEEQLNGR